MEKLLVIIAIVVIIAAIVIIQQWYKRAFNKKFDVLKKQYENGVTIQIAYGEAMFDFISKMANLLSIEQLEEMCQQAAKRKAFVLDCEKTQSTTGEVMACDEVASLLTPKTVDYVRNES